jgi:hypothetical protein
VIRKKYRAADHFVIALDLLERSFEKFVGIDFVSAEPVLIGLGDSLWRVDQAFSTRVITGPEQ